MGIKYLGTNEIGRSRSALGFPSVKTCQAIVYQTESHLYGFHDALANDTVFGKKAEVFRDFVQAHALNHATLAKCMIGVITGSERFSEDKAGKGAWSAQLKKLASVLGFNGPIWGARVKGFIDKGDSSYFRFDFHENDRSRRCMLSYQTWSRMEFSSNTLPKDSSKHALLRPQKVVAASFDERPYEMVEPTEDNRPVQMKGLTSEGVMIVVDDNEFMRLH